MSSRTVRSPRALAWAVVLLLAALPAQAIASSGDPEKDDPQQEVLELTAQPVSPIPPPPPVVFDNSGSDYTIGRQDLLEIRVFGVDELSQTVRVADDGSITMPLLGKLSVGGLSKTRLEELIARLLGERYIQNPHVTVFVQEYQSKRVAVTGSVKAPGSYEMLGQKTLIEMISLAGGLDTDLGKEIIIFRPDGEGNTRRITVDLERLVYAADPTMNVIVGAGDIVYVPVVEKIRVFVSGAVNSPDLYEVPKSDPITVLKAITLAGGTTDRAAQKKVQIMRTDSNGERVALIVNLRKIKRGKAEDPILQADDIVLVPEAFF